ncbi:MAG: helix-turn-helix transcriptional regulator [Agathobacter sp.]|nr:helix-turn-helix transcriptional regulator [Agathobacter sp.]
MEDYGHIKIKLNTLIKERNISKNKLCHLAQMERSQINRYCNGTVTRLDTAVLCRICHVLDCSLSDLIEYIPSEKE